MLKKLFGGIDLTWKKLIIFAATVGIIFGIIEWVQLSTDTNFLKTPYNYELWILFGFVIIANSKSALDSALKSGVFFIISQSFFLLWILHSTVPLTTVLSWWINYILLATFIGYIGYYIKKQNALSVLILSPILIVLSVLGLRDLSLFFSENSYSYLLSAVLCLIIMAVVGINMLNKRKLQITAYSVTAVFAALYLIFFGGILLHTTTIDLSDHNIQLNEYSYMPYGNDDNDKEGHLSKIIKTGNNKYELEVSGQRNNSSTSIIRTKDNAEGPETEHYITYHFDKMGNFSLDSIESVPLNTISDSGF